MSLPRLKWLKGLDKLELEGTKVAPSETGEKDAEEDNENGQVYGWGSPCDGATRRINTLIKHEEDASELHLEATEADEVHFEAEGVGKEHTSSLIITMASIQNLLLLR